MRKINIYFIEDNTNAYTRMENTLDHIRYTLRDIDPRYKSINITGLNPLNLPKISSDEECKNELKRRFEHRPPHVMVLDWELRWGQDPENPNYSFQFDGDQIIEFIDKETQYTPYIIFTSTRSDRTFPEIVEGAQLRRLYPHTINLIKKSSLTLTDEQHEGYDFNVAVESMRMGIDYALMKEIPLTIFKFPDYEEYRYIKNDSGKWEQKTIKPFAIQGKESKQDITVTPDEIVSFLIIGGYYAIILLRNEELELYMCHFKTHQNNRISQEKLKNKLPFLKSSSFLLYNERYLDNTTRGSYSLSLPNNNQYAALERNLRKHVERTYDLWNDMQDSKEQIEHEKINPFYDVFCGFDTIDP